MTDKIKDIAIVFTPVVSIMAALAIFNPSIYSSPTIIVLILLLGIFGGISLRILKR